MKRRDLIKTGLFAAAGAVVIPLSAASVKASPCSQWDEAQRATNTFLNSDTLGARLSKLNRLMSSDFALGFNLPSDMRVGKHAVTEAWLLNGGVPMPEHPRWPYRWSVYLTRKGQRWSGSMTPIEFMHWTAQVGLGYRIAKAQLG